LAPVWARSAHSDLPHGRRDTGARTLCGIRELVSVGVARLWRRAGAHPGKEVGMRLLIEITPEGDIIDDGEIYALFHFDPEGLGDDPIE